MDTVFSRCLHLSLIAFVSLYAVVATENGFCRKLGDNVVTCDNADYTLTRLESEQVCV